MYSVCSLTRFNAKEALGTVKGKDAQVALAVDDHIASGGVEDGAVAVDLQPKQLWVVLIGGLLELSVFNEVRIRPPDFISVTQCIQVGKVLLNVGHFELQPPIDPGHEEDKAHFVGDTGFVR